MKLLSIPEADISKIIENFKTQLLKTKTNENSLKYEVNFKDLSAINKETVKKPLIYFSREAFLKMQKLVETCTKEIAWQATVEKLPLNKEKPNGDFYYYIDKVFVYPQTVTGTFVDVDPVRYTEWSLQLPEEIYNKLRFQGHSHVNMTTSASGVDLNTYQQFLDQLKKDDFYIFMIMNKRGDINTMVYDYAQNILFENEDCFVDVLISQGSLTKWIDENMKQVVEKTVALPTANKYSYLNDDDEDYNYSGYDYGYGYGGHSNFYKTPKQRESEITYATNDFYIQNSRRISFTDDDERAEFFLKHPRFISNTVPSPEVKELMDAKNRKKQTFSTETSKRGRPHKQPRKK